MAKPGPKRVLRVCGALTREKGKQEEQHRKPRKNHQGCNWTELSASHMDICHISVMGEARKDTNNIKPR